jgi:site-specific recombinase XerD
MFFYLKKNKTNSLVIIRYHIGKGKPRFVYSTGINVNPDDWNFKEKQLKSKLKGDKYAIIRDKLNKYNKFLEQVVSNYEINNVDVTKDILKTAFENEFNYNKKSYKTIIDYFNDLIDELIKVNKAKNTIRNYKGMRNKLMQYEKHIGRALVFRDFKGTVFFNNWLSFSYEINNSDNTISRSLGFIKTFLIWTKNKGLHSITNYSHLILKSIETDDIALTKQEVFEILNYNFKNQSQKRVVDMFLIGCFTGQRFSDYSVFDKTDYIDGKIEKRAQKTKVKTIIPVDNNPYLKNLLELYDWNLPTISNQKFNKILKQALSNIKCLDQDIKKTSYQGAIKTTKLLKKWEMCSSHTARRSFISVCLTDGWTYKEVMAVSGIRKVETINKYDKVDVKRLNNKTKTTWNNN